MERDHVNMERVETWFIYSTSGIPMPGGEQPGVYGEGCGESSKLEKENQCLQSPCHYGY